MERSSKSYKVRHDPLPLTPEGNWETTRTDKEPLPECDLDPGEFCFHLHSERRVLSTTYLPSGAEVGLLHDDFAEPGESFVVLHIDADGSATGQRFASLSEAWALYDATVRVEAL